VYKVYIGPGRLDLEVMVKTKGQRIAALEAEVAKLRKDLEAHGALPLPKDAKARLESPFDRLFNSAFFDGRENSRLEDRLLSLSLRLDRFIETLGYEERHEPAKVKIGRRRKARD
jgi:hypothetical protein